MIEFNDIKIIEYSSKYLNDVRKLLTELEEYIVSIDEDNLDCVHGEYYEKMAVIDLEEVTKNNGKCFLAIYEEKVIGLIMGCIFSYGEYDYLDYKCPKRGTITELVVSKDIRSKGVGNLLIKKLEDYFKNNNCEYVILDVFAYNDVALNFYKKHGYHSRMITEIKKL